MKKLCTFAVGRIKCVDRLGTLSMQIQKRPDAPFDQLKWTASEQNGHLFRVCALELTCFSPLACKDVEEAEALALLGGMHVVRELYSGPLIVESDCAVLVFLCRCSLPSA